VAASTASRRAALSLRPKSFSNGKLFREIPRRIFLCLRPPHPARADVCRVRIPSSQRCRAGHAWAYHALPSSPPPMLCRAYGATDNACIFLPRHARGISRRYREIPSPFRILAIDGNIFRLVFHIGRNGRARADSVGSLALRVKVDSRTSRKNTRIRVSI